MSVQVSQSPQRRKLHLLCDEIGLSRPERLALARYLLRRDFGSFSELDEEQVQRMLDATEGFQLICELGRQRSNSATPASAGS